jgi:hypothetical protein
MGSVPVVEIKKAVSREAHKHPTHLWTLEGQ